MSDPQGQVPSPFIFPLSQTKATSLEGGSVKVVDSTTFPISTQIAVAEVTVEPGAIRELHVSDWMPTAAGELLSCIIRSGTRPRTNGRTTCKHPHTPCLGPR